MSKKVFSTQNLRDVFSDEEKLETFNKLRFDLIHGNQLYDYDEDGNKFEISKKDANKAVRKVLMEIVGLNEDTVNSSKNRKRAISRKGIDIFEVTEEDIEFKVEKGLQEDEWFDKFVDYRNEALGDSTEFYSKEKIMLVVAEVAGSLHDFTIQNLNEATPYRIKTKNYAVKIGKDIDLVLLGRIDYTDLVDHITEAYIYDVKGKCLTAMYGAAEKIPNNSQFNKGGTLNDSTKNAFDELLEDVSTANGGAEVYIVGTKMALKKINALAKVDWASEEQKRDMNTFGRLGFYESTPLIEVPQRFKFNDISKKVYNDNILFVFANTEDRFIKFVDKGEVQITEAGMQKGDLADDFQTYEVQRSYGAGVILGQYFGCWNTDGTPSV